MLSSSGSESDFHDGNKTAALNLTNEKEQFADTCHCRTFPLVVVSHERIEQNVDASKICMGIL